MQEAKTEVVRARIETSIKTEAQIVLDAIGLTVSQALRLMLIRIAHDKALPFEPLIPNEVTLQAMRDARAGHNLHRVDTVEELMKDLNADDTP